MIYLAWSGGLDSTYALVELLRQGYPVHAHHTSIYYQWLRYPTDSDEERPHIAQSRTIGETQACRAIAKHLHQLGYEFDYTETAVDFGSEISCLDIFFMTLPFILNEAKANGITDTDRLLFAVSDKDSHEQFTPQYSSMFQQFVRAYCDEIAPVFLRFGRWQSREAHIKALGEEIANMTVSCSRPKFIDGEWVPCGSAKKFDSIYQRHISRYESLKACTCADMLGLLPKYDNGWAKNEV